MVAQRRHQTGSYEVGSLQYFTANSAGFTTINACFFSIGATGNLATTEADRTILTDYPMIVQRVIHSVPSNTRDQPITLAFRAAGASIGAATYTAGETGKKNSGALSVYVPAGSGICFLCDTSLSTTGSNQILPSVAVCRILI